MDQGINIESILPFSDKLPSHIYNDRQQSGRTYLQRKELGVQILGILQNVYDL